MIEERSENDIDGSYAMQLRRNLGITQEDFWGAVRVSQPRGHRYEMGVIKLPASIRLLLFVRYVAGLDLDNPKQADFRNLKRLLKAQRDNNKGDK